MHTNDTTNASIVSPGQVGDNGRKHLWTIWSSTVISTLTRTTVTRALLWKGFLVCMEYSVWNIINHSWRATDCYYKGILRHSFRKQDIGLLQLLGNVHVLRSLESNVSPRFYPIFLWHWDYMHNGSLRWSHQLSGQGSWWKAAVRIYLLSQ